MSNECLDLTINNLGIEEKTLMCLEKHQINYIKELWKLSRKDLKKMNLGDTEINLIIIKMQLMGIDLNQKIYNKD